MKKADVRDIILMLEAIRAEIRASRAGVGTLERTAAAQTARDISSEVMRRQVDD